MRKAYNHIEDFLEDVSFRKWVLSKGTERNLFWETWGKKYPEKVSLLLEAKEILLALGEHELEWEEENEFRVFSNIDQLIDQEKPPVKHQIDYHSNGWIWMRASVILVILTLGALASWQIGLIVMPEEQQAMAHQDRWIIKSAQAGEKKRVHLPDGSEVILNSSSEIRFREGFGQSHREIFLEGESFFEVAKDSLIPFRVKSGKLTTVALGTSFNIKAFKQEGKTQVKLISGKVKVENQNESGINNDLFFLTPGEEALLTPFDFKKTKFNQKTALLWTEGILFFDNVPFSEVVSILERWYGVQITVTGILGTEPKVSGEFNRDNLENVLNSIGYTFHFNFQIKEKAVSIHFNKKPK